MRHIESYLQVMKKVWQKEPRIKSKLMPFYLTPEERYERLQEIMKPLSQETKHSGNK
ncbi:hypothetical protein [Pseudocitrobacter cyperus]|uniref:Uncharacterized protein n=1 Tax=Pseudocitrobacter cyperus TaxID=3112843 RepID=A0ABV0HFF4_9ENTR